MRTNQRYVSTHPDFIMPPPRLLHETYRLDYSAYAEDGLITAKELMERCRPHLPRVPVDVLEWGCGVARLTRHLPVLYGVRSVTGVDVNEAMIGWNKKHIAGVAFHVIGHEPPIPLAGEGYDLVMAVSVFTHIPGGSHAEWLGEIRRILRPGGVFLFTTQGSGFLSKLSHREMTHMDKYGFLTRDYHQRGHRMMSTFQHPRHLSSLLSGRFETLSFTDGATDRSAAGGQDLWLVRRQA